MKTLLVSVLCTLSVGTAAASPDCYDRFDLAKFRAPLLREMVIALDETVSLPKPLVDEFQRNIADALQPGDHVGLLLFSTFSSTRYMREMAPLVIEAPPSADAIKNMPMAKTRALNDCIAKSRAAAAATLQSLIASGAEQASPKIARSEILMALRELGRKLQASSASRKILVLVTDGLEFSAITSFYRQETLKQINVAEELAKVRAQPMLKTDLANTAVYIFGGGMATSDGYREGRDLLALEDFWTAHIKASNGQMVAFGKPNLLVPIK